MSRAGLWAVVPVKRFAAAKSRLAPALDPAQRTALARAMLGDVLQAVGDSEIFDRILVVTGDADAAALARRYGAEVLQETAEAGTNAAAAHGLRLAASCAAAAAAVIPGDVPLVTPAELRRVRRALEDAGVVLVPATRDGGTNLLALAPPGGMQPAFGCSSLDRHVAAAEAAGLRVAVLPLPGAGHDIDVPADLDLDPAHPAGGRTRACLRGFVGIPSPYPSGTTQRISLP